VFCPKPALADKVEKQYNRLCKADGETVVKLKRNKHVLSIPKLIVARALRDALAWGLRFGLLVAASSLGERFPLHAFGVADITQVKTQAGIQAVLRQLGMRQLGSTVVWTDDSFPPVPRARVLQVQCRSGGGRGD